MALVEKFHVVASDHAVGATNIKEGQLVIVAASGVAPYAGTGTVFGIAGDTKSQSASAMPGVYTGWQNRASDGYDETKASRQMTVYHSGGEFATDQFESGVELAAVGAKLYAGATGLLATSAGGADTAAIAILTRAAGPYPSGVPGTDINGDMALRGDNNSHYIEFKLLV